MNPRLEELPNFGALSMDAPSPIAKGPNDFTLVKLTLKDEARMLDSKKAPRVEMKSEKLAGNVYRVRPEKPLEPGEYAICLRAGGQLTGQLWEFGID